MELKQAIEEAKELAKKDYHRYVKMCYPNSKPYPRKWNELKLDDGRVAYGLEGTPDKAFVFVSADHTKVTAHNGSGELLATFIVAE